MQYVPIENGGATEVLTRPEQGNSMTVDPWASPSCARLLPDLTSIQ